MKRNTALITGGSMGIGYELAKCFAAAGYDLVIAARTESDLKRVALELGSKYKIHVTPISTDLFDPGNAFSLFDDVTAAGLKVDVLVNNAGQGLYGKFKNTEIERERDIVSLNISSVVILTKLFLKPMLERGEGKILNVSSIAGKMPGPYQSVYHATKAFVQSFSEALRNEVKEKGIVVTSLLPGATDTDFFNKAGMQRSKIFVEGELADPADVARDGFDALMRGDDMVVSGFKNKMEVGMSKFMPDSAVAEMVRKQQEPVNIKGK